MTALTHGKHIPAPYLRRLASLLYDAFLLIGALFGATLLAFACTATLHSIGWAIEHPPREHPLFRAYLLAVCALFYCGFWTHGGQTLGMRAWRLRLQMMDGTQVRLPQALLRFSVAGLWIIPPILMRPVVGHTGSLWVALCGLLILHAVRFADRYSGTELVLLPKRGSSQETHPCPPTNTTP